MWSFKGTEHIKLDKLEEELLEEIPNWFSSFKGKHSSNSSNSSTNSSSSKYPHDFNKHWDMVKNEVVICIKTGSEVQDKRIEALKETWMQGRDIPHLLIVSDVDKEVWPGKRSINLRKTISAAIGNMSVGVSDAVGQPLAERDPGDAGLSEDAPEVITGGWAGDANKNLPALKLMYQECPSCRVYFLVDDDTYVLLENLAQNLLEREEGILNKFWSNAFLTPHFGGRSFIVANCFGFDKKGRNAKGEVAKTFAHGGAGILMNNKALSLMVPHIPKCMKTVSPVCYAGDMQVSLCLWKIAGVNIGAESIPVFQGEHLSWAILGPKRDEALRHALWSGPKKIVTMHQLPENEQLLLHDFEMSGVTNLTFRNLKNFAMSRNLKLHPRRRYFSKKHGNTTVFFTKEVFK